VLSESSQGNIKRPQSIVGVIVSLSWGRPAIARDRHSEGLRIGLGIGLG